MTTTLALCQLHVKPADETGNIERALDSIAAAAAEGADIIALPELFDVGYFAFDAYDRLAEGLDGSRIETLSSAAAEHDVWLLGGSIVEDLEASAAAGFDIPEQSGLANTAVLFDRSGESQLIYRKHHLFGYESAENRLLTPGRHLQTATVGAFTVGVTTCYDLRFPEVYRELTDAGVTLTLVPSAWPYPRVEHWKTLGQARAIENLAYVATVNGAGEFDDAALLGRSSIYDPWGTPIAAADDDPTIVMADIDADRVDAVRADFPALRDRRL